MRRENVLSVSAPPALKEYFKHSHPVTAKLLTQKHQALLNGDIYLMVLGLHFKGREILILLGLYIHGDKKLT